MTEKSKKRASIVGWGSLRWVVGLGLAAGAVCTVPGPSVAQATAQDTTPVTLPDSLALRPVPAPVVPPPFYRNALTRAERSADGSPGPNYWTQWSNYDISAKLDPATALLQGKETIRYHNRSPYNLRVLVVHLYQNLYSQGVIRGEPEEITGGMKLSTVVVGGTPSPPGTRRAVRPTRSTAP